MTSLIAADDRCLPARLDVNSTLRVERKFKGGLKLVEDYALSTDPRLLTVSSEIEGGRMPRGGRTVRRVYDSKPS